MTWTIPNVLTIGRILAAPCLALVFVVFDRPLADWLAFGIFVSAALTDFFDGWLARRLGQISEIGKMLDPIADKAMVIIALGALVWSSRGAGLVAIPAIVIVLREVLISGLREYLGDVKLPVTRLAKWKTTVQMLSLALIFYGGAVFEHDFHRLAASGYDPYWNGNFGPIFWGSLMLWIAAALTVITGWDYFRKGLAYIREREGE